MRSAWRKNCVPLSPRRTSNTTTADRRTPSIGFRSMSKPRIAIDAMGGDHAPEEIVAGAILAAQEDWGELTLVGDEARVRPLLQGPGSEKITLVHAPDNVPMDMHASQALRIADK